MTMQPEYKYKFIGYGTYFPLSYISAPIKNALYDGNYDAIIDLLRNHEQEIPNVLRFVVGSGRISLMKMIASTFNYDIKYNSEILLQTAVDYNQLDTVKYLLQFNDDINFDQGILIKICSTISKLCISNMLQLLIRCGACIDVDNQYPMRASLYNDNIGNIKLLIDNNASVPVLLDTNILRAVINNKNVEVIKILLDTNILRAVINNKNVEVIKILLDHEVKFPDVSINNQIITIGDIDIIRSFINFDITFNINFGLQHYAGRHRFDIVELLLDANADVHSNNNAALAHAVRSQNI